LPRAITDFGAEVSFAHASARLREHYGIDVPASGIRACTLSHAQQAIAATVTGSSHEPVATLLTEIDGSHVPLVETVPPAESAPTERGPQKRLFWKEARLAASVPLGSRPPVDGATLGATVAAGWVWQATARRAGLTPDTEVHGLGDGADWIAAPFDQHFGGQGRYLIDFYHVCEYRGAAAPRCAPAAPEGWRQQQAARLKANPSDAVLAELARHLEAEPAARTAARADEPAPPPVRDCHRYLSHRREHLDDAGALAKGWPIGSGLIEGGHRHVVQARLKKPGAWWRERNARGMIALRVLRANGDWERYWQAPHHQNN
jgi:hypothetical protein